MNIKDLIAKFDESKSLKKSSWKELISALESGCMYYGSSFNSSPEEVAAKIDSVKIIPFEADRKLDSGKSSLKLKRPDGKTSTLSKTGVVFKYGDFFINYNEKDGNNVVVYRYQ